VDQYLGRLVLNNPEIEPIEQENLHTNRIVPVYPLMFDLTHRWLRTLSRLFHWAHVLSDALPETPQRCQFAGLGGTSQVHFQNPRTAKKSSRRLNF
jgi:ATP-dependent DNA helicase RecG